MVTLFDMGRSGLGKKTAIGDDDPGDGLASAGGVLSTVEPYNGMLISWCYYCITFVAHIIPTPFSPLQPVSMPMPSALLHRPL